MEWAAAMVIALCVDAAFGWPDRIHARVGHPVTWIGGLVDMLDRAMNRETDPPPRRRVAGIAALLITVAVAALSAAALTTLLPGGWTGTVLTGILAAPLVAARSLRDHVVAVERPLATGDLREAREAVSMIVGRDPTRLDPPGIARAALESLAENTSDGVIAPLFWGALLGLPGIAAYKAINTLDSMIGHRNPRHEAFGWASARTDDLVNLIPARATALLFAMASGRPRAALACVARDARRHRSPNAGWPEAAMAGALDVRLSGPRVYGDRAADEPWVNGGALDPSAADLRRGLLIYRRAVFATGGILALLALS